MKDIGKHLGPLYSKTSSKGQRHFNFEDKKAVQKIKNLVKDLPPLDLPLHTDYLIIETDGCEQGWRAVLLKKPSEYEDKSTEKKSRYSSSVYHNKNLSSLDYEIMAVVKGLKSFSIFIIGKKFTIRTDCEAIVKFYEKLNESKISQRRWALFRNYILNHGLSQVKIEHIKGKNNFIADALSRLII